MYSQSPDSPNCGPTALRVAIRALGARPPGEHTMAELCRTREADGTGSTRLLHAARHFGYEGQFIAAPTGAEFYQRVRAQLDRGRPTLICVDNWEHWCCAIGLLRDKIVLIDPSSDAPTNGITLCSKYILMRRALFKPRRDVDKPYFAMSVYKP